MFVCLVWYVVLVVSSYFSDIECCGWNSSLDLYASVFVWFLFRICGTAIVCSLLLLFWLSYLCFSLSISPILYRSLSFQSCSDLYFNLNINVQYSRISFAFGYSCMQYTISPNAIHTHTHAMGIPQWWVLFICFYWKRRRRILIDHGMDFPYIKSIHTRQFPLFR